MSKVSCPTPGSPLSQALFTVKLYPSALFTRALPEKVTQGVSPVQSERVDRQAVHLQARGVVDVLELAVEHAAPRTGVESESGDIAARPELPATVMNALPVLAAGMKFTSLWAEETMMFRRDRPVGS